MPVLREGTGSAVDVAVIGAGAAGLAAARHLQRHSRLSSLVLEAGDRLGGRARTVVAGGAPLDLGCAWLHAGETNAWAAIAPAQGFTVDRRPAPWNFGETRLNLSVNGQTAFEAAEESFHRRITAALAEGRDPAMGDLVDRDDPWRPMLETISSLVSGAALDRVSCRDHETYRPGLGNDWRVVEGYGALVAAFGADVPVLLDTAVTVVDHAAADRLRLETNRGTLEARAVVVTVSTNVIAAEALRFRPALPGKVAAAAHLPLGVADKLWLALDPRAGLEPETYRIGSPQRPSSGAYHIRPFGRPVIECFWGGDTAQDLERGGRAAMLGFAIEELGGLFGSGIAAHVAPLQATAWAREPFIRGSYAYAVPGAAEARADLAAPVDGRLFFVGEATSPQRYTTAHGAYESGVAAAEGVIASLGEA